MRAVVYHGPRNVQVDDKPHPTIQDSEDVILRITSTALCGSDLNLYHGTVPGMEPGQTLGHEFMGVIEDRLLRTKDLGAEIINFDHEDPVEKIKKESKGKGVICVDAVGYEAVGHTDNNKEGNDDNSNDGAWGNTTATIMHDHSKISDPASR
jgi:threonine dehydrogenase-like Zn-dependent dehydrogenase